MKRLILLCCFVLGLTAVEAQDIIIMHDTSQVEARVEEIGSEQIKYRKYDNLGGPIYSIERSEVFIIRYENGTREVITPLEENTKSTTPTEYATENSSDEEKYAHITAAQERVKEDLHKKRLYFTVQGNLGYSLCSNEGALYTADGLSTGFDIFGEFFPSKKSSSGALVGLGYNYKRYILSIIDQHINLNALDINLGYSYRSDVSKFFMRAMLNINVPFNSAVPGYYFTNDQSIDMMDITHTTVGILYDAGAHFGGFNVGGRVGFYFNDQFEECTPALVIGVHIGYTF